MKGSASYFLGNIPGGFNNLEDKFDDILDQRFELITEKKEDELSGEKLSYEKSGVSLEAADEAVFKIKDIAAKATRPEVLNGIGGFGGMFALNRDSYNNPVLVAGSDGVGTKLKIAFSMGKHDTVGEDCVAMCVNDILVQGAEPLFFLDYLAVGKLDPGQVAQIVTGVANGCQKANCALLGGETAEMPGFYPQGEYDLAGFAVGIAEKEKIVDGRNIRKGDLLIGLSSTGVHSNGFSLVRKIMELKNISLDSPLSLEESVVTGGDDISSITLGEELLKPTEIYVPAVLPLLKVFQIKGMVHITGGGLPGNIPRILPQGMNVRLYPENWKRPFIFDYLREKGKIELNEMYRVFNMGVGFVLIVSMDDSEKIKRVLKESYSGESWLIGEVASEEGPGGKVFII